ncbi:MAG: type IV pilus modification protein PilV [Comamonadaceae bacterium]|nr:type IV pilus modification protein PilV [Burkholderiales bacterium]MEB2347432.1 type IV pilus modification protein PilV [Comamonadaceae bacterium]
MPTTPSSAHRQHGITLIESLIAVVVTALGILGILGVQMRTLADTQTTVRRAQAIRLIEDLGERIRTSPNALADPGAYVSAFASTPPTGKDCATNLCTRTELAAYDLRTWKQAVTNTLPLGQANIFEASSENAATGNRRLLGVMVSWRENERDDLIATDRANTDATQVRAADGSLSAGAAATDATCPSGRNCQLQYLPIAARCAPYESGGVFQYFCPGA